MLPTNSKERKETPIATGVLDYFPRTVAALARLSWLANEKHNPGEPVHWAREKSNDHADCAMRHFMERGKMDTLEGEDVLHIVESAWRVLALAELELEERSRPDRITVRPGAFINANLRPGQNITDALREQTPEAGADTIASPANPRTVQFFNPVTKKYQTWTLAEDK